MNQFDDYLRAIHRRALMPAETAATLIVGSTARGWSNEGSDIDVIIVCFDNRGMPPSARRRNFPLTPSNVSLETMYFDGRRVDMEYWLGSQIDQMISKVHWTVADTQEDIDGQLLPREMDFLDRLVRAVPLTGHDWLKQRVRRLEESALSSMATARSLYHAQLLIEDAAGQLRSGDLRSSVLSARLAFERAVDGLLASYGECGQQPKWRTRRFLEVEQDVLDFDQFWAIETMRDFTESDPGAWVESVLRCCRSVLARTRV